MTIEASINTWVSLTLNQNKKVEDFEVHNKKTASDDEVHINEKPASAESQVTGKKGTEKTLNAINQMLGMNDAKLNATKANRIMRKKI